MLPVTFFLNPVALYPGWEEPVSAEDLAVSHLFLRWHKLATLSLLLVLCLKTQVHFSLSLGLNNKATQLSVVMQAWNRALGRGSQD